MAFEVNWIKISSKCLNCVWSIGQELKTVITWKSTELFFLSLT